MRLTAVIPLAPDEVRPLPGLIPLVHSLRHHGFEEIVFLHPHDQPLDVSQMTMELYKAQFPFSATVNVRARQNFTLEAGLHAATGDWAFFFQLGEELGEGPSLKAQLEANTGLGFVMLSGEVRGLRRTGFNNVAQVSLTSPAVKNICAPVMPEPDVFTPELPLTVILPTWRLGGLDLTLGALAKQRGIAPNEFEVILVDALHRWRADAIAERLRALPFRITHLDVDNSIFPVSSHSRFRNTAIRRARGNRLVFLSDYSAPPENFLAAHVGLPSSTLGISRWVRTAMDPKSVTCQHDPKFQNVFSPWEVIELARKQLYLWSTFVDGVDPLAAAIEHERANNIKPPVHLEIPNAHDVFASHEYMVHWKADSVDTRAMRKVNGWDERFDGNGGQADVDVALRLIWAGVRPTIVSPDVRILDGHEISVAPICNNTQSNMRLIAETRSLRAVRCVYGLVHGINND